MPELVVAAVSSVAANAAAAAVASCSNCSASVQLGLQSVAHGIGRSLIIPPENDGSVFARLAMSDEPDAERERCEMQKHCLEKIETARHLAPGLTLLYTIVGNCLGDYLIADDVAFSDGSPLRYGDTAAFKVAGDPWNRGKVFMGRMRPCLPTVTLYGSSVGHCLAFWQWNPCKMLVVPEGDFEWIMKISHVARNDELIEVDPSEALSHLEAVESTIERGMKPSTPRCEQEQGTLAAALSRIPVAQDRLIERVTIQPIPLPVNEVA